ncbi:hypothetical protein, partial [Aquabacterium sp.]|uniref:hypothetical protein n=1 Tax=Aquabacterium sp. TaxID=1872578 RepID=UPI002B8E76A0
ARMGNMRGIRDQAEHLAAADARYRPLAARLRRLAEDFESVALLDMLTALQAGTLHDVDGSEVPSQKSVA